MAISVSDYPYKGPSKQYNGYFEIVDAHDPSVAAACKCKVGQSVGRVYGNESGLIAEKAGSRDEAEAFVVGQMALLKVGG